MKKRLCGFKLQTVGNTRYEQNLMTGSITGKSLKKEKELEIPAFMISWMNSKNNKRLREVK